MIANRDGSLFEVYVMYSQEEANNIPGQMKAPCVKWSFGTEFRTKLRFRIKYFDSSTIRGSFGLFTTASSENTVRHMTSPICPGRISGRLIAWSSSTDSFKEYRCACSSSTWSRWRGTPFSIIHLYGISQSRSTYSDSSLLSFSTRK